MADADSLERDYVPPLDGALFSAIASEYDLSDAAQLDSARQILDALKQSALADDSSLFDPSGTSSSLAGPDDKRPSQTAHSSSSSNTFGPRSEQTDLTASSSSAAGPDPSPSAQDGYIAELESADFATKLAVLKEMFPRTSEYSISHTLKKADSNYNRALEELLNHAFFSDGALENEEDRVHALGVDAFSEDNTVRRVRKRKDNKKHRKTLSDLEAIESPSTPSTPKTSAWDQGRKDVEFISSRVGVSTQAVASFYHENGTSISATILALAASSGPAAAKRVEEPVIQANAAELGRDFPSIPSKDLIGLVRLTHPSTSAAHELAKAVVALAPKSRGGIQIIPQYAALDVASDDESARKKTAVRPDLASDSASPQSISDPTYHRALAAAHDVSADRYFNQASAAYRRGKSDRLMGAAAGYYSQMGRDSATKRSEATSDAADALVQSQSSLSHIDLHGVSVKDAVRISRLRTEQWWRQGGRRHMGLDGRVREEGAGLGPLTIVTGIGNHSKGGVGKLGPAVGRMLIQEGWQVVFGQGVFTVTGRRR